MAGGSIHLRLLQQRDDPRPRRRVRRSFGPRTHDPLYWCFFVIPAAISAVTALYMTRCWMLLFWGKPRNAQIYEKSRSSHGFWFPLFVLAVVSLIGGSRVLEIKQFVAQAIVETENYCNAVGEPSAPPFGGFANTWPITADRTSDAVQRSKTPARNSSTATPSGPSASGSR